MNSIISGCGWEGPSGFQCPLLKVIIESFKMWGHPYSPSVSGGTGEFLPPKRETQNTKIQDVYIYIYSLYIVSVCIYKPRHTDTQTQIYIYIYVYSYIYIYTYVCSVVFLCIYIYESLCADILIHMHPCDQFPPPPPRCLVNRPGRPWPRGWRSKRLQHLGILQPWSLGHAKPRS